MNPRTTFQLLFAAAIITLIGTGFQIFKDLPSDGPRTANLGLLLAFGILVTVGTYFRESLVVSRAYLLIGAAMILTLFFINSPDAGKESLILFFVLTSCAMLLLPTREALVWAVGLVIVELGTIAYFYQGASSLGWLSAVGGHFMFAGFGYMMRQSNVARQRTEQLYVELQEAHAKLQRFAAQSQQLAVSEERNRLAREMHDSLGHRLTVAILQLEGAHHLIQSEPERAATMVGNMRDQLKEALVELRRALSRLRTPTEQTSSSRLNGSSASTLIDDLQQLINTFEEATGLTVHTKLPLVPPTLQPAQRLALFRASQELLTNVQRHAVATQVWLTLAVKDGDKHDAIRLMVADDGQGMPAEVEDGRFGLRGLQERAAQLEGTFCIEQSRERGTLVEFVLPLSTIAEAQPTEPEELVHA